MIDLLRETARTKDKYFGQNWDGDDYMPLLWNWSICWGRRSCSLTGSFNRKNTAGQHQHSKVTKFNSNSVMQFQCCGYAGKRIGISSLRNWWVPLLAQLMKKGWFITRRRQATGNVWEYICHENQYKYRQQNSMRHSGRLRRSRLELWPDNIHFTSKEIFHSHQRRTEEEDLGLSLLNLDCFYYYY